MNFYLGNSPLITVFFRGILFVAVLLVFTSLKASALEIAGVDVPESAIINNESLVLNGAGIRKKIIIKVYVGGLYLSVKQLTAKQVLADPGPKRIFMSFLYKEVSTEKLVNGWNEGFAGNNSAAEMQSLQDRINQFNSMFTTVYKGDEIRLDYLPGEGTQVWINEALKGSVPGEDFYRALLKIWLGDEPADEGLKNAMLGNTY